MLCEAGRAGDWFVADSQSITEHVNQGAQEICAAL